MDGFGVSVWLTLFLVIQTGTIAAVAVGFARYFGVFVPLTHVFYQTEIFGRAIVFDLKQIVAVSVILFLSFINCFGIRLGVFPKCFYFSQDFRVAGPDRPRPWFFSRVLGSLLAFLPLF